MNIFDGATTIAEIDRRYKESFVDQGLGDRDTPEYWVLSEAHRRALASLGGSQPKATAESIIMRNTIRNWALEAGVPLGGGGRVTHAVENAYRTNHDMPTIGKPPRVPRVRVPKVPKAPRVRVPKIPKAPRVRIPKAPKPLKEAVQVRAWARANGMTVGARGRVHPDVMAAWRAASHNR